MEVFKQEVEELVSLFILSIFLCSKIHIFVIIVIEECKDRLCAWRSSFVNFKRYRVLALQVLFLTKHKLPCLGDIVSVEGGM